MSSISGTIGGVAASKATQALVRETLQATPASQRDAVRDLFKRAAGSDRNRHLSLAEAQIVAIAATNSAPNLDAIRSSVDNALDQITRGLNLDGIKSYFSSTTDDLADVVVAGMREAVLAAEGKPVELNAMIFAFTEKKIADEMIALVKNNPNVSLNLITDFGQHTNSGGRQPPLLQQRAIEEGIGDRVSIKFKKDTPYVWNDQLKRPVYSHALSKGLNHHKGLIAMVDGKPFKLITGSYNWSKTAGSVNYESLFAIDANNPANRKLMADYQAEFTAFFNHQDSLDYQGMRAFKATIVNDMRVAHGLAPNSTPGEITNGPAYTPHGPSSTFDLNHLSDANYQALRDLVKSSSIVSSIVYQYATYGAFTDFANLVERVPKISTLSSAKQAELEARLEFGEGSVPLATATADELSRSLKISKTAALAIVAKRTQLGDFESVSQIRGLPGITDAIYERIAPRLNDDLGRAFFSARAVSDAAASTGYDAGNKNKKVPVANLDGTVSEQNADLASGVIDLVRRAKPGETMKIAQYGFSLTTREYSEIISAAGRGVRFKIVLDKGGNAAAAAALKAQAAAGLPIEVRVQKRTMHQKFGSLNDDAFFGSSNFSGSSIGKNSEDRFVVKNNPELAAELSAEHDLVWAKSDPV